MGYFKFKDNGVLEVPSKEELEELDIDTYIISYTDGTMSDGRPFYAYIAVVPSKYQEFHEKTTAQQPIVLNDYGIVITADFAPEPPPEIIDYMRENYLFDESLSDQLQNELATQRAKYIEKKELSRVQDIVEQMKQKALSPELKKKMSDATGSNN